MRIASKAGRGAPGGCPRRRRVRRRRRRHADGTGPGPRRPTAPTAIDGTEAPADGRSTAAKHPGPSADGDRGTGRVRRSGRGRHRPPRRPSSSSTATRTSRSASRSRSPACPSRRRSPGSSASSSRVPTSRPASRRRPRRSVGSCSVISSESANPGPAFQQAIDAGVDFIASSGEAPSLYEEQAQAAAEPASRS